MKSLNNYIIESKLEEININKLINYINENNGIKLSNVLKNISKNKEFIKLLNEYDYEYTKILKRILNKYRHSNNLK